MVPSTHDSRKMLLYCLINTTIALTFLMPVTSSVTKDIFFPVTKLGTNLAKHSMKFFKG